MKQHPLYLGICIFASAYLAFANARGWSFFHTFNPGRMFSAGGGHGSSFSHK
jgi:hypothetical protein